ncbi:MAG: hypothetical protein Q8K00_10045 [Syntrophales bacterium]|nr:hypothetical protein [Syntrophales bacterium]
MLQLFSRLFDVGEVHHPDDALLPVSGSDCLNVRIERLLPLFPKHQLAGFRHTALNHLIEENIEDGTGIIGNKGLEGPANQPDALCPKQARSGVVRLADRPAAFQEKVACGGKIEQGFVKLHFGEIGQRLFQIIVLFLQRDPVNLEFMNEVLTLILRFKLLYLSIIIPRRLFRMAWHIGWAIWFLLILLHHGFLTIGSGLAPA